MELAAKLARQADNVVESCSSEAYLMTYHIQ